VRGDLIEPRLIAGDAERGFGVYRKRSGVGKGTNNSWN
jgi:hypothetical protein